MKENLQHALQEAMQKALQVQQNLVSLRMENEALKHEIQSLKVELSKNNLKIENIKKEQEFEQPDAETASGSKDLSDTQDHPAATSPGFPDIELLKEELKACIADVDSCIEYIQSRE